MRKEIKNKKILVVGDSIIDQDYNIEVTGLSLESPTIKGNLKNTLCNVGGAANVVKHLYHFGCNVSFLTALKSEHLLKNYCTNLINLDNTRDNLKNRYWIQKGDASYKHLQINDCNTHSIECHYDLCLDDFYDLIIVSDYRCGVLSNSVLKLIESKQCKKIATSQKSDKQSNYHRYKNFDIIIANQTEYKALLEENFDNNVSKIIVTMGDSGAEEITKNSSTKFKSYNTKAINTIGAGDAFCAAYAATESIDFANRWASYQVSKNMSDDISMEDFTIYEKSLS